jgi:hypothetical protein
MRLHRVTPFDNDRVKTELVGRLPYAATDGSLNTFFEASLAGPQNGELPQHGPELFEHAPPELLQPSEPPARAGGRVIGVGIPAAGGVRVRPA